MAKAQALSDDGARLDRATEVQVLNYADLGWSCHLGKLAGRDAPRKFDPHKLQSGLWHRERPSPKYKVEVQEQTVAGAEWG